MSVSLCFYRKNLCCYRLSLLLGLRLRIGKLSGGISRNSEGGGGGGERRGGGGTWGPGEERLRSRGTSGTPSTHNDRVIAICVVFDFSITFCR